ncbi:hypothetical protein ACWDYJ_07605 [Streptomyces sp. NPDC003042]
MSESSFETDVLAELGDDKLTEIAGLLGTDVDGARDTVAQTVSRVVELLIPAVLAVFAKRAASGKGGAGTPTAGPGTGPARGTGPEGGGLGDLLGQILGGGKK